MNATSSPSRKTPLKESVNPYQSRPAALLARGSGRVLELAGEDRVLVVQRLVAARTQDRLPQPLQPEDEQQRRRRRPEARREARASAPGPNAATTATSPRIAAATPASAERQPRVSPAASTIVSASTISTALARNDERTRKTALTASLYQRAPCPPARGCDARSPPARFSLWRSSFSTVPGPSAFPACVDHRRREIRKRLPQESDAGGQKTSTSHAATVLRRVAGAPPGSCFDSATPGLTLPPGQPARLTCRTLQPGQEEQRLDLHHDR